MIAREREQRRRKEKKNEKLALLRLFVTPKLGEEERDGGGERVTHTAKWFGDGKAADD